MSHQICDSCETVAHCKQHGCIPFRPNAVVKPQSTNTETMRAALKAFLTGLEDSEHDSDVADCVRRHEYRLAAALAQAEQRQEVQRISDTDISAWAQRHDINGDMTELRRMFEDARTFIAAAPQPEEPDLPAILQRQAS